MNNLEERLAAALRLTAGSVREDSLRPLAAPRRSRRRSLAAAAPIAAAAAVVLVVALEVGIGRVGFGPGRAGSGFGGGALNVGGPISAVALDPANKTLYVTRNAASNALTLVGTAACDAVSTRGCARAAQVSSGGPYPQDVAVIPRTQTVYVLNGGRQSTLAVLNAATCDAATTRGCVRDRFLIHLPPLAMDLAVNPRTETVYVFYNRQARMSVVNGQTCNAGRHAGCASAAVMAAAPALQDTPVAIADPVTDTLYYAVSNNRLAVIDGRTCGAAGTRGCGTPVATAPIAGYPTQLAIDQSTGTLYATGTASNTLTVINRNTCQALDTSGCGAPLRVIRGGPVPLGLLADAIKKTVYVTGQAPDGVAVVNASACRAGDLTACPRLPARFPAGPLPQQLVIDPMSNTLYVAGQGGAISMVNTATCNAATIRGCPRWPRGGGSAVPAGGMRYSCGRYVSGLPARRFAAGAVRVATGSAGGVPWSLWARKGTAAPLGIEMGGLVVNGRWYGLCTQPLMGRYRAMFEAIDTGGRGIVYGFIETTQRVKIKLSSGGSQWTPSSAREAGLTFFIGRLPRPACAYRAMTARFAAAGKPLWSGQMTNTFSACAPGWLVIQGGGSGSWGPGLGDYQR